MRNTGISGNCTGWLPCATTALMMVCQILFFAVLIFADTWQDTTTADFSGGTTVNTETVADAVQIAARSDWWEPASDWWNPSADWWESGSSYQYRKAITVNNTGTSALSDYQLKVLNPVYNETGLVGSWHFEETAGTVSGVVADTSGWGNTGTMNNFANPQGVVSAGKFGNGMSFDGSNDYVQVADSSSLDPTTAITMEAWVKPTNGSDEPVIAKEGSSKMGYIMHILGNKLHIYLSSSGTGWDFSGPTTGQSLTVDGSVWYHIVATWSSADNTMRQYINGTLDVTAAFSASSLANSSAWIGIGRNSEWGSTYFNGTIDEVRIYNRVLTVDEIYARYQAKAKLNYGDIRFTNSAGAELPYWAEKDGTFWVKASGTDSVPAGLSVIYMYYGSASAATTSSTAIFIREVTGLVGAWNFDEGTGSTAKDTSGNSNNGSLVNNPAWTSGKYGNALQFNGSNNYVNMGDASAFKPASAISLEAWVYSSAVYTSYTSWMHMVHKRNANSNGYGFWDNYPTGSLSFTVFTSGGDGRADCSYSSPVQNTWYHLVAAYDGATLNFYVNGIPQTPDTSASGNIVHDTTAFEVGRWRNIAGEYLNGKVDEVRVYNRALTSVEVTDIYSNYGYTTITCPNKVLVRKYVSTEPVVYIGSETGQSSQWQYRRAVAINNPGSSALSDYQVKVENPVYNENGLLGSWHFSEGFSAVTSDTSGNGNTGTLANRITWTTGGRFGNGLSFDGSDDYLDMGDPSNGTLDFGTSTDFSIALWLKTSIKPGSLYLLVGKCAVASQEYQFDLDSSGKPYVYLRSGANSVQVTANTDVANGNWHYIVATIDRDSSTGIKIYVDGALEVTGNPTTIGDISNATAFYIGRYTNSPYYYYNGLMDEVEVFSRVMTDAEISARYNGNSPKTRHDYADIRFVDSSGTELPYWMEKDGVFWVRVGGADSVPTGLSRIQMYYGNSSATGTASGTATFEFFDDFSYSSVDTSKWSTVVYNTSMTNTISNGEITIAVTSSASGNVWGYLSGGTVSPAASLKIRSKDNTAKTYPASFGFGHYLNAPQSGIAQGIYTSDQFYYQTNLSGASTYTSGYAADNNWHITEIFWTTGEARFYRDNTLYFTSTTNIPSTSLPVSLGNIGTGGGSGTTNDTIVDWVFARKYAATEPVVSTGSEVVSTSTWLYRQPLTITNTSSTDTLPKGYTVNSVLNIKSLSSSGKAQYDGDDVTVVYKDPASGSSYEIDRILDSGQALGLDGVDDYVSIPDSTDFDFVNNNVTMNLWIRPTSMPAAANGFISQVNNSQDWCAYVYPNGSVGTGKAGINEFTTPAGTVVAGNWYFVTIQKNGGTSYIYINGTQAASGSISMWTDPSNPIRIGGYVYGGSNYYFTGSVDEVTIFKRALLTSEISELYNSGIPKPLTQTTLAGDTNLIAYYPFDADFNDKAKTNNGTAMNGASLTNGKLIATDNNKVWFRTISDISASGVNSTDYFVYYGNSGAVSPAANPNNVNWFYDDFARPDNTAINNWYETGDGSFSLSNYRVLRPDATTGLAHTALAYSLGQFADVVIRAKINTQSLSGSDEQIGIIVRGNTAADSTHRGYVLAWHENSGQLQNLDSSIAWLTSTTKTGWAAGEWWNMELLVYGNTIKGKAWEDGTVEPSSYDITDTRTTNSTGYVGLYTHSTATASAYFDDFSVRKYITSAPAVSSGSETPPYNSTGSFTSAVKDTGEDNTMMDSVSWSTSGSGTITMQVRAGNSVAGWTDSSPVWEDVTNGDTSIAYTGRYLQYKALFAGQGSGNEPVLTDVTIAYTLPVIPPSDSVSCGKLSNTWYSTATFTFTNDTGFGAQINKYYYVFDADTTHIFDQSESVWNTGVLSLNATADGDWYLHYLPYSITDTAGTAQDLGPFKYDATAPPAVSLSSPSANASISSTTTSFAWDSVTDLSGITYALQLDNYASFSSPVINKTNLVDTAYTLAGTGAEVLVGNSTYYWRVVVTDGAGNAVNGGYRKFTTTSSVPQMVNESTGEAYPDIQSAINSASTVDGDVINVKDTIAHDENITISKDVIVENAFLSPSSGFAVTGQGLNGGEILRNCVITKGGVSNLALGENLTIFNPDPSGTLTIQNSHLINCLVESGTTIINSTLENCSIEVTSDYFTDAANGDFHLVNIAVNAIDQGKNLSAEFTKDKDGFDRGEDVLDIENFDAGAWDIGAYEFVLSSGYLTQTTDTGTDTGGDTGDSGGTDTGTDAGTGTDTETGYAIIAVNPSSLIFSAEEGYSNKITKKLTIYNGGTISFNWTIQKDIDWISIEPVSGSAAAPVDVSVEADVSGLPSGAHTGTITILSTDAVNSPVTIAVSAVIYQDEAADTSPDMDTGTGESTDTGTSIPNATALLSPHNGSESVYPAPVLSWEPSTQSNSTYWLQISRDVEFTNIFLSKITSTAMYQTSGVEYGTTYYWRVKVINLSGVSEWSESWWFRMRSEGETAGGTNAQGCFLKRLQAKRKIWKTYIFE